MKIDGKKASEASKASCEWRSAIMNGNGRHELATPKLQVRPESGAKLMQARKCDDKAAIPLHVPAGNTQWVSFETPCKPQTADFPDHNSRAQTRRPQDGTSGEVRKFHVLCEFAEERIVEQHKMNVARHFTNTWHSRLPAHQQRQLEEGSYFLVEADGRSRHCCDYMDFANFTGAGHTSDLPERVLHVAGPQLHNFLCQTYLYNPALSLFGHVGQRRVEPMPDLLSAYHIARNENGQVRVQYTAHDDSFDRAMMVGADDHDEYEARALAPASILFSGTLLFSPDGSCAIGPVQIHATAMHFPEPLPLAIADTFA